MAFSRSQISAVLTLAKEQPHQALPKAVLR
jgi:hypothetical protein